MQWQNTLKNLFLDGLPVCFTNHLHDKTHKKLNKLKSLENLMRYTGKAVHKLYKQLVSQKFKSYTEDVIAWTKNDKAFKPEFVKKRERNIRATIQQSDFSEDDEYFSEDDEREGSDEDMST